MPKAGWEANGRSPLSRWQAPAASQPTPCNTLGYATLDKCSRNVVRLIDTTTAGMAFASRASVPLIVNHG
jgi:hypothetical protein